MPREVSDIKQFIEISRRKDASCTFDRFPRAKFWKCGVMERANDGALGSSDF